MRSRLLSSLKDQILLKSDMVSALQPGAADIEPAAAKEQLTAPIPCGAIVVKLPEFSRGQRCWLFNQGSEYFTYNGTTLTLLCSVRPLMLNDRFILYTDYEGKLKKISVKSELNQDLLEAFLTGNISASLFVLPSLTKEVFPVFSTLVAPYYTTLFASPRFLFHFGNMNLHGEGTAAAVLGWRRFVTPFYSKLIPLLLFQNIRQTVQVNCLLRANTFVTAMLTQFIKMDKAFMDFCNWMDLTTTTSMEFVTALSNVHFSLETRYLMYHLSKFAGNQFPDIEDAVFYPLSGILFLRVMSPIIITNHPDQMIMIKTLTRIFNLSDEDPECEAALKNVLRSFLTFDGDYKPPGDSSSSDASAIASMVAALNSNTRSLKDAFSCDMDDWVAQYNDAFGG